MTVRLNHDDRERHVGRTLSEGEENYHDDSDFYAVVFIPAHEHVWTMTEESSYGKSYDCSVCDITAYVSNGIPENPASALDPTTEARIMRIQFDTTRGYQRGTCTIDATDEVKAAADTILVEQARQMVRADLKRKAAEAIPGRKVRISEGKKAGTEGTVFWRGDVLDFAFRNGQRHGFRSKPPTWAYQTRVGIVTDSGERVFEAASIVTVIAPEPVDESEVERLAQNAKGRYRMFTHGGGTVFVG